MYLWTHGMQFWQICQFFILPENLKTIVQSRKIRKSFVSFRKCFLEMFRWRRRRPSWQNPSFCAIQNFLNKFRREIWNWFFSGNIFKTVFGHPHFSFDTPGEVLGQKRKFFTQYQKMDSKSYFLREITFFSKCFSGHTECSFDNSAKTVSPKNWKFLLISQNSKIFGFSQKFFLETFNWSRKMPSWRPWSFPSSQNVLSKTMKRYKNLTSCREVFFKYFFWKHRGRLLHPRGKSLRKLWTFSAQSQKIYSKLRFREKYSPFRQIASIVAWSAFAANMLVIFRQTTVHSSLRAV